jgi:hypothetical protein
MYLLDLFFHAAAATGLLFAFYYAQEPGMILNWYARLLDKIKPAFLAKPLGGCPICTLPYLVLVYLFLVNDLSFTNYLTVTGIAYWLFHGANRNV